MNYNVYHHPYVMAILHEHGQRGFIIPLKKLEKLYLTSDYVRSNLKPSRYVQSRGITIGAMQYLHNFIPNYWERQVLSITRITVESKLNEKI